MLKSNVKSEIGPIKLESFLPYQVALLAERMAQRTMAVAKEEAGLNLSQWRVMAAIAETPGRTANEVVAVTPMDKGIVSRAVKSLLEMDLISRQASQTDGRVGHLFLTEKGGATYYRIADGVREIEGEMYLILEKKELQIFEKLLLKLSLAFS